MAETDAPRGSALHLAALALTLLAFVAAFAVRGVRGAAPLAPTDRPREDNALREPLQLLGRSAAQRVAELDERVASEWREEWRVVRRSVFELQGCPDTVEWMDGVDGQRCERLLGELRRGGGDDALAALVLVVELARRTDWAPGLLARTADAERLALLLQDWLRAWGERGAEDPTLGEPVGRAVLLYGRVMQRASHPLPVGRLDAPFERARAFLELLTRDAQGQPTALARALRARHPAAWSKLESGDEPLLALDQALSPLEPGLDGECQ